MRTFFKLLNFLLFILVSGIVIGMARHKTKVDFDMGFMIGVMGLLFGGLVFLIIKDRKL